MRFTVGNTVISIDVILGQDPGAGSQVENFRRTTRRTVSADLTDCHWDSEDELCLRHETLMYAVNSGSNPVSDLRFIPQYFSRSL